MVEKFISANPDASAADVVKATRSSLSTVQRARRNLISDGVLLPAATGRPPGMDQPTTEGESSPDEIAPAVLAEVLQSAALGEEGILDRDARRRFLSALVRHPKVPPAQKISAVRELEATEPKEAEQLGPGAPQTRDEAIHRVALMIEALMDLYDVKAVDEATHRAGLIGAHVTMAGGA